MKHALIVHVVHHFDTGGMENGMVNLFNMLAPERFRHVVICLTDYTDFRQRISAQAVDFYALNKSPGHDFSWMPRLWALLRQLKPDIVHTRNLSALEAQFVAAAAGIRKTVHGEHGRDVFDLHGKNRKYTLLRRTARPFVSQYIAVSRDLAGWLHETVHVPISKIQHIYNGVDCVKFHPRDPHLGVNARPDGLPQGFAADDSVVFGSVGRMAEVKDYLTLTRAFIHLTQNNPDAKHRARLVIVGEGIARMSCLKLLAGAGLTELAWLPGERHDIAELLRTMDVFVLPSLNEGISNTLLEAQASALPVIATRVGGNVELVEEAVTGYLLPPGDVEGMARVLLSYLDRSALGTPKHIAQQGARARQRVASGFSIPAMADAYAHVYEQLLTKH
ncbi:MAG: TIGR03088 family PEP-CTERM/XrtA system glycosyltransferase [Thiobacillaceae bacterium]